MPITLTPLTNANFPAVKDLLLPSWNRAWDDSVSERILRWRFFDRSGSEALVALDGDRCVAMMDSWLRRYIIDNEVCQVREMADWYSRTEYRGAGLDPMWRMMRRPQPGISAGGTRATRDLLPRLGWRPMPQRLTNFVLPIKVSSVLEGFFLRSKLPGSDTLARLSQSARVPIGRVRRHEPPGANANVRRMLPSEFRLGIETARPDYDLVRLVDERELAWLNAAPREMGEFETMIFRLDSETVGISVYRLSFRATCLEARILHIQASSPSVDLYAWIASETVSYLVRRGAASVRCRTSSPELTTALRKTGFFERPTPTALWWWSKKREAPKGAVSLSYLVADASICPYPTDLEIRKNLAISTTEGSSVTFEVSAT